MSAEYQIVGRIIAKLTGGPNDGEELVLTPNGSLDPPAQLVYFGAQGDTAGWHIYEYMGIGNLAMEHGWPKEDANVTFPHIQFRPLGK